MLMQRCILFKTNGTLYIVHVMMQVYALHDKWPAKPIIANVSPDSDC